MYIFASNVPLWAPILSTFIFCAVFTWAALKHDSTKTNFNKEEI